MNDAPVVKEDITTILTSLDIAYPRVKRKDDPDITPPEISATELARQVFSDQKDKNDNLGLVLLGSVFKPNGVGRSYFHFILTVIILTLKAPIMTAADDIHKYFFIVFQRK